MQFWSDIILVISNRTRAARSFDFEITRMISDQIALHSVQLPLFINSKVADQQPLQASGRLAGNGVTRVVIPFKDQDSTIVKRQLKDLSIKLQPQSSPYLSVGKLAKTLKNVRPNRSWLINSV